MQGSLEKRGKEGVWYARIRIHGEQKRIRLGKMTKAEAERALRQEIDRRERSLAGGDRKITFQELASVWLDGHKLDKKPNTIASYGFELKKHLVPFFGKMVVNAIRPEDVSKFRQQISGLVSVTTVNYNLRLLRSILEMAIKLGYAYQNAAKLVPKLKAEKRRAAEWSKEDCHRFLKAAESVETLPPGQFRVLVMFAVMTGLRLGEILAATWNNLDLKNSTYLVTESYSPQGLLDTPKTEKSYRTIDLPGMLVTALREHKARQNEHRLKLGPAYENHDLIFASESGTFINPSNLRNRMFYPALTLAGVPEIRFHDLRGVNTTLLLEAGAPLKYVQDHLGHTTPDMTLRVYAKVTAEGRKKAMQDFEDYLGQV